VTKSVLLQERVERLEEALKFLASEVDRPHGRRAELWVEAILDGTENRLDPYA
jgi:hypothetical protein